MLEFLFGEDLIAEWIKEGNYGEVNGTAVVKTEGKFEARMIAYNDGDDIEDVLNKVIGTFNEETSAIESAESYFNDNIR